MQGIHSIYKQKGPSSHDIINKLRKVTGIKTIGHAGTLDPLARGVLVVGICRWAVRKLGKEQAKEKEYLAKIKLGEESSTDDADGVKKKFKGERPDLKDIKKTINDFRGQIEQKPPAFSAIKIKGVRAYKIAAKGNTPKLKTRKVNINKIKLIKYKWPYLDLKVVCGPGTYIRSLARDIGKKLKIGGYLAELERIRVGNHTKEKSYTLEKFEKEYNKRKIVQTLCLILKKDKLLLGLKKRGFGADRWNGFGGKLHGKENLDKATKRELKEEARIEALEIIKRGIFKFEFQDSPKIIEVHLFECKNYNGQPCETEEMKPKWFDFNKIPYQEMWPDDKFWLPLFLKGKNLRGEFYFENINKLLYYSLREVKNF